MLPKRNKIFSYGIMPTYFECMPFKKFCLLHLKFCIFCYYLFDFDSESMTLILIAAILVGILVFHLSLHNSLLLTFISEFGRLVHGQKMARDR